MGQRSDDDGREQQAISELIARWLQASRDHDVDGVLALMTDDVLFLVPGQAPFGKAAFAEMARQQAQAGMRIEAHSELVEICVYGDWAHLINRLTVTMPRPTQNPLPRDQPATPPPMVRAGHTLTVLRKDDGRWRIARDANLLVTISAASHD